MNCQNCRKPHNGNYILVLGMFKVCQPCQTAGQRLDRALKQGVEIESVNPTTGHVAKTTYRS
jgi:hypothetical protein